MERSKEFIRDKKKKKERRKERRESEQTEGR